MEQKDAATFIILVIAIIIFFLTLSFYKRVRNKRKLLSIDDHYEFIFKLAMENEGELNVVKLVKSSPYNYRLAHQYLMQSHQNGLSERVYLEEGEESYIF